MRSDDLDDENLDRLLAALPRATPEASRDARMRARCHAALRVRRAAVTRDRAPQGVWHRRVVPILVAAFCVVYLSAMVVQVIG